MDEVKKLARIYQDINFMTVQDAVKGTHFEVLGFPTNEGEQDEVLKRIAEMHESTSDPEAKQSCKDVLSQAFQIKEWLRL